MRRSGTLSVLLLLLGGCFHFPYGFAGGGLPPGVHTVAVLPFENETASPELQGELVTVLRQQLRGRLGLRDASESRADAIVRGTLVRYDADVPVGYSANPVQSTSARRRLQIVLDVEIVEQATGRTLLSRKGLTEEGEYAERDEPTGRRQAIVKAVSDIIDGAQSQW